MASPHGAATAQQSMNVIAGKDIVDRYIGALTSMGPGGDGLVGKTILLGVVASALQSSLFFGRGFAPHVSTFYWLFGFAQVRTASTDEAMAHRLRGQRAIGELRNPVARPCAHSGRPFSSARAEAAIQSYSTAISSTIQRPDRLSSNA